MKKKAFYFLTLLAGIVTISCEQGPSLQQYFVEKMDDPLISYRKLTDQNRQFV
ncbi:MAG: Uncharacterised protein [uncultured Bacteroidota bacterium]|nr:MAG: Uncharacterised protein [uncultured Bacteroidetes bacterium]